MLDYMGTSCPCSKQISCSKQSCKGRKCPNMMVPDEQEDDLFEEQEIDRQLDKVKQSAAAVKSHRINKK